MKSFFNALAIILSIVMVLSMGLTCYAAPEDNTADSELQYKMYITDDLADDIATTGKNQEELLKLKADELDIHSERAYELELECGLRQGIFTKDELPLPETTVATEPTENTQEIETTTIVLNTEGTTAEVTDTTEVKTTANTDPTETTSATSQESTPTEAVTEPSEILTESVETTIQATENISEPTSLTAPVTDNLYEGTNRYYFYRPQFWIDNEYSDTVGIYWWEGTDSCTAWPGYEAEKADIEGVYYYDVPKDVTTIIWNNLVDGGFDSEAEIYSCAYQTGNIGSEWYDPGESILYPDGNTSFDGMIYVCNPISLTCSFEVKITNNGEWYYYYGSGEYGITPEKGDEFYTCSFQTDYITSASFDEALIPFIGDVNGDGKLNIRDATLIQKYVAKLEKFDYHYEKKGLADYNKDYKVNIKDATLIQKKIANLI